MYNRCKQCDVTTGVNFVRAQSPDNFGAKYKYLVKPSLFLINTKLHEENTDKKTFRYVYRLALFDGLLYLETIVTFGGFRSETRMGTKPSLR